jgi:putative ABC transport system substrate-binding protein
MRRRDLLALIGVGAIGWPLSVEAQQAAKPARIGYLGVAGRDHPNPQAFLQGLRDLGYIEGRNLVIEYRDAEGKPERLPALAAELVALNVDVIVAGGGTLSALAAMQATKTLPVVFPVVGDPVADGLVTSLARPGGNVTGLSAVSTELTGKLLELLTQAVPGVSRIALLLKPDAAPERTMKGFRNEADTAARALGVQLQVVEARGPEDFDPAFSEMSEARAGALAVLGTPVFLMARQRLADLTAKNRLPTVFSNRDFVDAGGLMSYGPNFPDMFRRTATYATRSSRAPSRPIFPCNSRPSLSW